MKRRRTVVFVLLGLLLVALVFVLVGFFPQDLLRGYLERRIQEALGPGSSIRRMHVVPGRLRADVYDLVIDGPTYRLEVPRGEIAFNSELLFRRRLSLRFVRLENPRLILHPPPAPHPETPPFSQPVTIDDLVVTNGTVTYQVPPPQKDVIVLQGVDAKGSIGSGPLVLSARGGEWQRLPQPFTLAPMQARLRVSPMLDVYVDRLEAGTRDSRFVATGSLGRISALRPDLHVQGNLDLADLARLGRTPSLLGDVSVDGRISQLTDKLNAQATVQGKNLRIGEWPIDRVAGRLEHFPDQARTSASLTAGLLGGRAEADLNLERGEVNAHLKFSGLETETLRARGVEVPGGLRGTLAGDVHAKGPLQGRLDVRGTVEASGRAQDVSLHARVALNGRVDPRRAAVDLGFTADVTGSPVTARGARWRDLRLTAKGRAEGALPPAVQASVDGSVGLVTSSGVERVPFTGQTRFQRGRTSVDLTAQALGGTTHATADLAGSVARSLHVTASGIDLARLGGGTSGRVSLELGASGPLRRLAGSGFARVDALVWQGVRVGPVSAQIDATGGRGQLSFAAPELSATGRGTVDLEGFHGTLALDNTPLAPLQPLISPDRPLSGRASGTVQVDLPWRRPEAAVVQARLDNVEVESGTFVAHAKAPFTLISRNGQIELSGLDIEGPGLAFQGGGRIGRGPTAPLDLRGHLAADLTRFAVPADWTLRGQVEGDVAIGGTVSRPTATGQITVRNVEFQRPGLPLVTVADGEIQLERDTAYTTGLRATWPGGSLGIVGRVPLAAVLTDKQVERLGLQPASFDIEASLDLDLASLPARPGLTMTGTISGDLVFSGTRAHPDAVGFVDLHGVAIQTPRAPVLTVDEGRIELAGAVASAANLQAGLAGGTLTVSGTVPLAALIAENRAETLHLAPGEADLHVVWKAVQAAILLEAMRPDQPSKVTAELAGEARLNGRFTSVRSLRGELRLEPTTARIQDVEIRSEPLRVVLEDGRVTTDGLVLQGPGGTFRVDGTLDLAERIVQASGRGQIELRALSPLLSEASVTGVAEVDVSLSGPLAHPQPEGTVRLHDGTLRMRDIRQPLTALQGLLTFDRTAVRVENASAVVGGGEVEIGGSASLLGLTVTDVHLTAKGDGLGIRYPVGRRGGRARRVFEDLKARVNVDLTVTGRPGDFLLAGNVVAERSLYDSDIFLEESLLPPEIPAQDDHEHSPFLHSIGLNVLVATENPFLVRNNLAQLEAEGAIWLRGGMDDVAPFGRFELRPGGKVFLQGREFAVDSGSLTYNGSTDPEISIQATTLLHPPEGDVEVVVVADGQLSTPRLSLRSTPSFSESEIASLIATGQRNATLDSGGAIVGEQAAALLAGRFTRQIARQLMDLGLDQVDIQPELLAREGEPSARFTFGKQLTGNLRLVYSTSLSNPEAQYYQALLKFRPGREIAIKAQRGPNNAYTVGAGQQFRFGAPGRPTELREYPPTVLREVRFEGNLREFLDVQKVVRARPGRKVTYWDLLDDADRIRDRLVVDGFLEAVIETRLEEEVAIFSGVTGARYRWRVEGMDRPPDLTKEIHQSLFEEEAIERGRRLLLSELWRRQEFRANVEATSVKEDSYQTLVFKVDPGPVLRVDVSFPGARILSPSALLAAAGGPAQLLTAARDAETAIRDAYRKAQHLVAKVGPTQISDEPGRAVVVVPIEEGPAAVISAVRFTGTSQPPGQLEPLVKIPVGSTYDPLAVSDAVLRLRDYYLKLGYPTVRVRPDIVPVQENLELVFAVLEGQAVVVGPIEVTGLRRTRESLVRQQIEMKTGEPLDPRKLTILERRLRELGIFRRVVVTADPGSPAPIHIELEEEARVTGAYDVRYNADEGMSGLLDAELQNVAGRGLSLGGRLRGGQFVREARGSLHAPSLFRTGDLTLSLFRLDETVRTLREAVQGQPPPPILDLPRSEQGLQIQQAYHRLHPWDVLYGYRFKQTTCPVQGLPPLTRNRQNHLFEICEQVPIGLVDPADPGSHIIRIGAVEVSGVRDTRNSFLNPTRGSFMSVNLAAAHRLAGSDFDFLRHFVQVSFLRDLTRSFVWAHGYRLGVIHTFKGERLPFNELFRAGGPNSVRGFGLDQLGPRAPNGEFTGGEAVVVVNEELRYHHPIGLGVAVFYDAGNVFEHARDLNFQLRHSAGFGLRYDSPVGLLRIDLAFPIDRHAGDRSMRWNFGLGQAF